MKRRAGVLTGGLLVAMLAVGLRPAVAGWCDGVWGSYPSGGDCNYRGAQFEEFIGRHRGSPYLRERVLCRSTGGRDVEMVHIGRIDGQAAFKAYFQARQHCIEWKPNYILEGIIDYVLDSTTADARWIRDHVDICIVPFVNKDNVEINSRSRGADGEYDLNRIWLKAPDDISCPMVAAIKRYLIEWHGGILRLAIDFHSPNLDGGGGGGYDVFSLCAATSTWNQNNNSAFARIVNEVKISRIRYSAKGGSTDSKTGQFRKFADLIDGMGLTGSVEVHENTILPEDGRLYGRDFMVAVKQWLLDTYGQPEPPQPDTTPPSVPQDVSVVTAGNTTVTLSWSPSTDDETGVREYRVYVDGAKTMTTTTTVATVAGLNRATSYSLRVSAVNYSDTESGLSAPVAATTSDNELIDAPFYVHAESGVLSNGMTAAGADGALTGQAIHGTSGDLDVVSVDHSRVVYTVDVVAGAWYVWGRFSYPDGLSNSYWIQVDNEQPERFGNGESIFNQWHWEGYMNEGAVSLGTLAEGSHTVTVTAREPAAANLLDMLCFAPSAGYAPTDNDALPGATAVRLPAVRDATGVAAGTVHRRYYSLDGRRIGPRHSASNGVGHWIPGIVVVEEGGSGVRPHAVGIVGH